MIRCEACGTANPAEAEYCTKCARKLDQTTQQSVAAMRASHTATGIRWSAVAVTTIILLMIVIVVLFLVHVL